MADSASWSNLPNELLEQIFIRLNTALDILRCCRVCVSWKSVASLIFSHYTQLPLLLIFNRQDDFCSLCDILTPNYVQEIYDLPIMHQDRWICSSTNYGWLLTVFLSSPYRVSLSNPISRTEIFLPFASKFPKFNEERIRGFITKCITSASPLDSECVVFVIYVLDLERKLAFCRPRDGEWKGLLDSEEVSNSFLDIMIFKGKFYATDMRGKIYSCDPGSSPIKIVYIIEPPVHVHRRQKYLVESKSGDFFMIYKNWNWVEDEDLEKGDDGISTSVDVYKMDLSTKEWKKIETLGDEAFFLGSNSKSSTMGKRGNNCIYYIHNSVEGFCDDDDGYGGFKCVSIYDMETRKSKRLRTSESWATQFHWTCLNQSP